MRGTLLKEQADAADDLGRARSIFRNSHDRRACLFHIGVIARKPAQAGIGVSDGGGNRLIQFVRQGGSQLSHGGHPVDACELRLRLTQRFFGPLTGADVHRVTHELHQIPGCV